MGVVFIGFRGAFGARYAGFQDLRLRVWGHGALYRKCCKGIWPGFTLFE